MQISMLFPSAAHQAVNICIDRLTSAVILSALSIPLWISGMMVGSFLGNPWGRRVGAQRRLRLTCMSSSYRLIIRCCYDFLSWISSVSTMICLDFFVG